MTNHTPDTHSEVLVREFLRTRSPEDILEYAVEMITFMVDDCGPQPDTATVEFAKLMTGDEHLAETVGSIAVAWHLRGSGPMPEQVIARTVVELLTQLT